jgi:hypothetical protein
MLKVQHLTTEFLETLKKEIEGELNARKERTVTVDMGSSSGPKIQPQPINPARNMVVGEGLTDPEPTEENDFTRDWNKEVMDPDKTKPDQPSTVPEENSAHGFTEGSEITSVKGYGYPKPSEDEPDFTPCITDPGYLCPVECTNTLNSFCLRISEPKFYERIRQGLTLDKTKPDEPGDMLDFEKAIAKAKERKEVKDE